MSISLRAAIMGAAILGAVTLAASARAADPDFCRDYARAAVNQYRQLEEHERCMDRARDYSRWSADWRHHYAWCLGVSRDRAWDERREREDVLNHCAHGDWDHDRWDHDRWDHDRFDDRDRYDH